MTTIKNLTKIHKFPSEDSYAEHKDEVSNNDLVLIPLTVCSATEPTIDSENNVTWSRVYPDGWVEQGGIITQSASNKATHLINFPVEMKDTNYIVNSTPITQDYNTNTSWHLSCGVSYKTTNSMLLSWYSSNGSDKCIGVSWEVKGLKK